jgi:hypothetical protein
MALINQLGVDMTPFIEAWHKDLRAAKRRGVLNGQAFLFFRLLTGGGSLILPVLAGLNLKSDPAFGWGRQLCWY